jgi:transmembrane sensor
MKVKGSGHMNPTEKATEWFAHIREQELSDADRKTFSLWLAESPVHVREYLGVAELWAAVQSSETWPAQSREDLILALHAHKDGNVFPLAIADGQTSIPEPLKRARTRTKIGRWFIPLGAVASVALIALIAWPNLIWRSTYRTSRGEQRSIVLSDGSVVQLNTLSTLVIHFDKDRRRVELPQGEALFRVTHDPARPFDVQTPFAVVRAVGTEFNVYNHTDGTQVAVIEGKVRVAAASASQKSAFSPGFIQSDDAHSSSASSAHQSVIPLAAGQQVTVSSVAEPKPIPANASTATAWIQRRIVLDNDSVRTAVDEFNRYNRMQIHVRDEELADLRISGVFDVDDPKALIKYLEQIQQAHTSRTGTGLTLDR